jgi:hypothetical protein
VARPFVNGVQKPQMMKTFNYTEKKLISVKVSRTRYGEINKKYSNWKGKDAQRWRPYKGMAEPFKARYGDNWEAEITAVPMFKKYTSIKYMIDHIIAEGNRIFENSQHKDTWMDVVS